MSDEADVSQALKALAEATPPGVLWAKEPGQPARVVVAGGNVWETRLRPPVDFVESIVIAVSGTAQHRGQVEVTVKLTGFEAQSVVFPGPGTDPVG